MPDLKKKFKLLKIILKSLNDLCQIFSDELHVLIEVFAPPGEAYSRMSHALEEIKKFLVPVSTFHSLQRFFSSVPIKNVP